MSKGSPSAPSAWRDFLRLVGYVRPFLGMLAVAVLFSWLYGFAISGRALLLEPRQAKIGAGRACGARGSLEEERSPVDGGNREAVVAAHLSRTSDPYRESGNS